MSRETAPELRAGTPAEYHLTLRQLQAEAIGPLLAATCATGLILIAAAMGFPRPQQGAILALALMLVPPLAYTLLPGHYLAGVWLLLATWLVCALGVIFWLPGTPGLCLLALPTALATLFVGTRAGLLVGAGSHLLMLAAPGLGAPGAPVGHWAVASALIWGVFLLGWLAEHPAETAIHWSWHSYDQARQRLELARDRQAELKQAIKDLADANLQMARLNQLLSAARRAAEEAERIKAQFVANVSHELRTPLNMIIGFSEMIMQAPHAYHRELPPALLADLAVIHRNSQHLSDLIDDVLDLSQIEAGRVALARERVAIREVVESAIEAVRPLYESKGLSLEMRVPEDLPGVFCDRTRIREVVLNLLSNAGRFTERGGVRVAARRQRKEIVVSVFDTGPGIAPADHERLIRPFPPLDRYLGRRHGGSGLGLSISRSFVELHGGRMWLESQVGAGTTFYFCLPVDAPAGEEAPTRWLSPEWEYRQRTRRPAAPRVAVRPRLVVVERAGALERLLRRYADAREIVAVTGLEAALQEMERAPAQALLVNDLSVSSALDRLRACPGLPPETPAIICSLPGAQETAEALGAAGYLVKPITQRALLAALDRLPLQGSTVLVVDDEPEAARLFLRMFAAAGRRYHVLRATDGQQALAIMQDQRPDVVLLDLIMPNMDGFRLLEARSHDPALRDIPVVVISARDPAGQPIVTSALAVTRAGGLSAAQLLACVDWLTSSLSVVPPTPPAASPG